MRRVFDQNPETALEDDAFLRKLKLAEVDETVRLEMQAVRLPDFITDTTLDFLILCLGSRNVATSRYDAVL